MSTQIASLYADLKVNSKDARQELGKFKREVMQSADSLELARKKTAILGTVFTATSALIVDSYKEYARLTETVRDLSLVSGESAESTSRFIQVLDDFQLTAQDATQAARFLKEQGLTPNLETLAQLSDEFRKIKDPAERLAFVQENLGRGGAKWVNVLNQGGDALRRLSKDVNQNLIISEQQIRMYELQRLAIDELMDNVAGFKAQLGGSVANIISYNQAMLKANEIYEEQGKTVTPLTYSTKEYQDTLKGVIADMLRGAEESVKYNETLAEQELAAEQAAIALQELTEANLDFLGMVDAISGRLEDYEQQHADITQQLNEGKITQEEAALAWQQLANEQELATNRMILKMLEQELALDGLTAKETDALLQLGVEWGIYSESAISAAEAARQRVNELTMSISNVPESKTITMTVNTLYNGNLPSAYLQSEQGRSRGGRTPHASGGSFQIPMSYGNEGFMLGNGDTASGGEELKITPKGQSGNQDIINAIRENRVDIYSFARVIAEEMMKRDR